MKRKQGASWGNFAKRIAVGVAVSLGIMLLVCAITAVMVSSGSLAEGNMIYGAAAALLLGSMVGAWCAVSGAERQRLWICLAHGGTCMAVLWILGALLFDSGMEGLGATAILCLGGSCTVGLVKMRGGSHGSSRKRRYKIHSIVHIVQ